MYLGRDEPGRWVQDRHAVAGSLAVRDELPLLVAELGVVIVFQERYEVRRNNHRHVVDGGESAEPLATCDVALEVLR